MTSKKLSSSLSESDTKLLKNALFASRMHRLFIMCGCTIILTVPAAMLGGLIFDWKGNDFILGIPSFLILAVAIACAVSICEKLLKKDNLLHYFFKQALQQNMLKTIVKGMLNSVTVMSAGKVRYVINGVSFDVVVISGTTKYLGYFQHPVTSTQGPVGVKAQLHYLEINPKVKLLLQVIDDSPSGAGQKKALENV
ncbi:hypothetical protein [Saezia sanguinis]|uniref:hypothetical protein n=1 Tax=Saezia sanguinis TaxID=1965230 RepID=UPI003063CB69